LTARVNAGIVLPPCRLLTEPFIRRLYLYLQRLSEGENDMDAAGMIRVLSEAALVLNRPSFQSLVMNGYIRQDELGSTGQFFTAAIQTLRNAPSAKIEAMFDKYGDELSEYLNGYNIHGNTLDSFRAAQMMIGHVTTIMAKSGLRG
jgi:hypothetical protein